MAIVRICGLFTAHDPRSRATQPILRFFNEIYTVEQVTSGQNKIDPRTPILVGQAQVAQHEDHLANAAGPIELMSQAVREAFADAHVRLEGTKNSLTIDALRVVRSLSTRNTNPARDIASTLDINANEYGLTPHGGNMPQYLVNSAALQIRDHGAQMIVLTGGESFRSRRRARAASGSPRC